VAASLRLPLYCCRDGHPLGLTRGLTKGGLAEAGLGGITGPRPPTTNRGCEDRCQDARSSAVAPLLVLSAGSPKKAERAPSVRWIGLRAMPEPLLERAGRRGRHAVRKPRQSRRRQGPAGHPLRRYLLFWALKSPSRAGAKRKAQEGGCRGSLGVR
jgi:hypothetical protein